MYAWSISQGDRRRGSEPAIVSLDHEDVLLERKKVQKRTVAQSFAALLELPGA